MNYNVYSLLSLLASQRSNKSLWVKGKKLKKKKKVTRQKPSGYGAKQERAALIEAVQAEVMDDHVHANQRD